MGEGDEHHLASSYAGGNRLRPLGMENQHASISGVPILKKEDEQTVTQAIRAMHGVNQKKHKALHEEGNLELQIRPMAYNGASIAWMRSLSMSQQEDWSEEPAIPDGPMAIKKQLK